MKIRNYTGIERTAIFKITSFNKENFKRSENFYNLNATTVGFANTHTLPNYRRLWTIEKKGDPFFQESVSIFRDFLKRHSLFVEKAKAIKNFKPLKIFIHFDPTYRLMRCFENGCCEAGVKRLYINSEGDVFTCPALNGINSSYIGNILHDSKDAIIERGRTWSENIFRVLRENDCKGCLFLHFCRGGCRYFGGIKKKDPYCAELKNLYTSFLSIL